MEIIFLGTGGAWGLPEHQCPCATCRHLRALGQSRGRTSLWIDAGTPILVDPGPDLRAQIMAHYLPCPAAVLITHEHHDHFLGLDELLCYPRNLPRGDWRPIPTYAHPESWAAIEQRFGYLIPSLLEKRLALPGQPLEGAPFGPGLICTPVKTDHGPVPKGSQGYILEQRRPQGAVRLGYTSDLTRTMEPLAFAGLDCLVCQCHFLNEPQQNRANHLSLQNALPLLEAWRPGQVYFVHLSCQDTIPGDEAANALMKKYPPAAPLKDPAGRLYPIPRDQASWQDTVRRVLADQGLDLPAFVAQDGLRVVI
jgi:phosphoribosyl 1,2-cyclic phosphate phosphodiesterase